MKSFRFPLLTFCLTLGVAPLSAEEILPFEVRPQHLLERESERDQHLEDTLPPPEGPLFFVLDYTKTWLPGEKVRVAFRGGDQRLRERIERIAKAWTKPAHLELSFRNSQGKFREWGVGQTVLTAEIRIGFDCTLIHPKCRGYWSTVGTDAIHPKIAGPGEPTMNLQDFDLRFPSDGVTTILHEFGHALGFLHEHQRPQDGCEREFRWEDDPGYQDTVVNGGYRIDTNDLRPGLRKWLKGAPHHWSDETIQKNFANLEIDSSAYRPSAEFDKDSIMKYSFPREFFLDKARLECYSPGGTFLSEGDKAGAEEHYPPSRWKKLGLLKGRLKFLRRVLSAEGLDPTYRKFYEKRQAKAEGLLKTLALPSGS